MSSSTESSSAVSLDENGKCSGIILYLRGDSDKLRLVVSVWFGELGRFFVKRSEIRYVENSVKVWIQFKFLNETLSCSMMTLTFDNRSEKLLLMKEIFHQFDNFQDQVQELSLL